MRKIIPPFIIALCVSTSFAGESNESDVSAKAVETTSTDPAWTAPILGAGVKSSGSFTDANLFFLYPWNNTIGKEGSMAGSMFFLEPAVIWGEGGEFDASFGLGYRRLFSNQSVSESITDTNPGLFGEGVYVGINTSFDIRKDSDYDNHFEQFRFGAELGSRYFELRFNYYLPLEDDAEWVGNSGDTREFVEIMDGWEAELAVLVPGVDKYMDVQIIGGYYRFNSDDFGGSSIEGFRFGVEARPVPNLVLAVTYFEDEEFYEDDWMGSISIEIPWGENPDKWNSAFKPRRRHLAERMFKPVRRKNGWFSDAVNYFTNTTEKVTKKILKPVKPVTDVLFGEDSDDR